MLTNTTQKARYRTKLCQKNISPCSGSLFKYLVSYSSFQQVKVLTDGISGQGPYFGQATWFARFHAEKIQSAIDRYVNEIFRVIGVLDKALEANNAGWLVGDKLTYADLSFITWSSVAEGLLKELSKFEELEEKFPSYTKWLKKMEEKDSVKKIRDRMARGRAEHGLK